MNNSLSGWYANKVEEVQIMEKKKILFFKKYMHALYSILIKSGKKYLLKLSNQTDLPKNFYHMNLIFFMVS